jgi:hypothetical protein
MARAPLPARILTCHRKTFHKLLLETQLAASFLHLKGPQDLFRRVAGDKLVSVLRVSRVELIIIVS